MPNAQFNGHARQSPRTGRRRRVILLTACVAAAVWAGCSIEKNYELLSFFFDGVPDPRLAAAGADAVAVAKQTGGVYYVHQPYAADACGECHVGSSQFNLSKADSQSCLKCHARVVDEHPRMHGPVAAVACLWCHAPHESTVKPLLRSTAPQICHQCHSPQMMARSTLPAHRDAGRDCLECHTGHGGQAANFLRDNVVRAEGGPESIGPAITGAR